MSTVKKEKTLLGVSILLANLLIATLLVPMAQAAHQGDGKVAVSTLTEKRIISFSVANNNDSESLYGFIVSIYHHGHFSEIPKTPDGWSAGTHGWHAVLWRTDTNPIQPATTEDNFAIEVTRKGKYTIGWSATDETSQPVAWGLVTITVT
jgi:hypothetical protein